MITTTTTASTTTTNTSTTTTREISTVYDLMAEYNTTLSAYTKYRHLGKCCTHPLNVCDMIESHSTPRST